MDIFEPLFQNCGDAVVVADDQGQLVYANANARSLLGSHLSVLLTPAASPNYELWEMQQGRLTPLPHSLFQELRSGTQMSDREVLLHGPPTDPDIWLAITGHRFELSALNFRGVLLLIRDISRHKASPTGSQAVSAFDGQRDPLTNLVNRAIFMDRIHHALTKTQQDENTFVAVLCLDVTRLKAVNDTFGYLTGDRLLVEIAQRLKQTLQPQDTLSRLGGDEFTVLLEAVTTYSEVMAIAEAIGDLLAAPFTLDGYDISIGINIGISFGHAQTPDADTLLRQADIAMNEAKSRFGEHYCVFASNMATDASPSLHLEMSLKRAIDQGELYLEYQPIFLVRSQAVIGVESLVRWQHPTRGPLSPAHFISVAEKTGLIIPLGWWVLEQSCQQLKAWQDTIPGAHNLFVSVNMSSRQFAQKDVLDRITDILETTQLAPQFLKIEMTESVLIDHADSIIEILTAIRAMGIKLSVDDFGTGYSSLSYLHRFPVDSLKIDRSFLENADSDYEKLEILQSVVRLAWNLGLEVVAEGIETPKHLAQVQALRCESGQGFLFSRPLGVQALAQILRSQSA